VIATAQASESPHGTQAVAARPAPAEIGVVVERDRRAGTERIIELGRWLILIYAAVAANFPTSTTRNIVAVNTILVSWALFNLAVTITLITRHLPSRHMVYAMTALDILVATGLVTLTGGFSSTFAITFYAVVIASSIRFGLAGSLCVVLVVCVVDLMAGIANESTLSQASVNVYLSHLFLYLLVALTTNMLARELVQARARQMEHTYRLEHAAFFELREVDRLKSEFIMLASHELRTPLAKVKAWLALIDDAGDRLPAAAYSEGLEVLSTETEHLTRLTDNLLCIAQLESGEIRLKTGPVNLQQAVDQVITRYVEGGDRGRCRVHIGDDARMVLADRERLALALACLVDNALKFSPESEPIQLVSERRGQTVRLEVVDNGRRIPKEQRERVFHSFYQLESPLLRQRGGAGVGLYLARQLVERMGGHIWIEGERARGNTFCVTLPADL
jgi:signal transduction histidine kinase